MRASSATGAPTSAGSGPNPGEPGAVGPVALIVDDDLAMRLLIRQTLERVGFACHEADNGIAALERFDQIAPDIVLLDVVMPGMNGYALCSELRRRPTGAFGQGRRRAAGAASPERTPRSCARESRCARLRVNVPA